MITLLATTLMQALLAIAPPMTPTMVATAPNEVAIILHLEEGIHTYGPHNKEALPTTLTWSLPEGVTVTKVRWPELDDLGHLSQSCTIFVTFEVLPTLSAPLKVELNVSWLACGVGTCTPGHTTLVTYLGEEKTSPKPLPKN